MKVESTRGPAPYTPITVKLTLETPLEAAVLRAVVGNPHVLASRVTNSLSMCGVIVEEDKVADIIASMRDAVPYEAYAEARRNG